MSYLINFPQEDKTYVLETPDDVLNASSSFLPSDLVVRWMEKAVPADAIQDCRFGRIQIVKLGRLTDAAMAMNREEARAAIEQATNSVGVAVAKLKQAKETT